MYLKQRDEGRNIKLLVHSPIAMTAKARQVKAGTTISILLPHVGGRASSSAAFICSHTLHLPFWDTNVLRVI